MVKQIVVHEYHETLLNNKKTLTGEYLDGSCKTLCQP